MRRCCSRCHTPTRKGPHIQSAYQQPVMRTARASPKDGPSRPVTRDDEGQRGIDLRVQYGEVVVSIRHRPPALAGAGDDGARLPPGGLDRSPREDLLCAPRQAARARARMHQRLWHRLLAQSHSPQQVLKPGIFVKDVE
jgi:hypothetical protein